MGTRAAFMEAIGHILAEFNENPPYCEIDERWLAGKMEPPSTVSAEEDAYVDGAYIEAGEKRVEFYLFYRDCIKWLVAEKYIRQLWGGESPFVGALTTPGFALLRQPLEVGKPSAGERLIQAASETGKDARQAAVGQVVGQIIGLAAKSLLNQS